NRLNELTQFRDSPILDVSSYQGRFVRTLATFGLTARTPDDDLGNGVRVLLQEVERAARFGFTASELEREKREMTRVYDQRFAERERVTSSSFAAEYVSYYLYGGTILDMPTEHALQRDLAAQISLGDVNAAVRDWTRAADRVLLASAPDRRDVAPPSEMFLTLVVQTAHLQPLSPYQDLESDAPLLRDPPTAG